MSRALAAEFAAWLAAERFHFAMPLTPERMLQSPASLTGAQRRWLREHIARRIAHENHAENMPGEDI